MVCAVVLLSSSMSAQTFEEYKRQQEAAFNQYRSDKEREYKAYRDRVNAEFAEYMRQKWPQEEAKPAVKMPDRPEPPKPVVKKPEERPTPAPPQPIAMPIKTVVPQPAKPQPQPKPAVPLPPEPTPKPAEKGFAFTFYGTPCRVPLETSHHFLLKGTDEGQVADGWKQLSADRYLPVVAACLRLRDELQLSDWGYVRLLEQMTEAFCTTARQNEARLMQMYILTQSGYRVRMARSGGRLFLLLPSDGSIYGYSYIPLGKEKYYVIDRNASGQRTFSVLNRAYPKEQSFSLRIGHEPKLAQRLTTARTLRSKRWPEVAAQVAVNKNLIDFLNDYPLSNNWDNYVMTALSQQAKEQLYPTLRNAISGKSKAEAANVLINFVQTAFDYKTDGEQFGSERPLFGDETLYYPYSDCEDRAILFAILVRDLLGLPVVLVNYPQHLATAVDFGDDTIGDYFVVDGRHYTVCDPTYIGADIGSSMPQYRQSKAEIITIGGKNSVRDTRR